MKGRRSENSSCHASEEELVFVCLLVRKQDTTVIQSKILNAWRHVRHETVILRVVGRLMNPTLGCKDIK